MIYDGLIIIRGGGDLATGTIYRLWKSGFRLLVLETENPAAIRRAVAVSEAVFQEPTFSVVKDEQLPNMLSIFSA